MAIAEFAKEKKSHPQAQVSQTHSENEQRSSAPMNLGKALASMAALGLASPFMDLMGDPFHGLIGLVILFVGMKIAWKMTAGQRAIAVSGPFELSMPSST
jgi:hypothetical protein